MTPTSFPSADDLLDIAPLVNGRVGLAQNELVRRLRVALPPLITAFNAREGRAGNRALEVPKAKDFQAAPGAITDDHIGKILVACHVTTSDNGPGAFKNSVQVVVFSVDERIQGGEQVTTLWERAELARLALFPYLNGCVDEAGRRVWRQLIPTGYALLPGDWHEYSGTRCTFNMVQPPSMDSGD